MICIAGVLLLKKHTKHTASGYRVDAHLRQVVQTVQATSTYIALLLFFFSTYFFFINKRHFSFSSSLDKALVTVAHAYLGQII